MRFWATFLSCLCFYLVFGPIGILFGLFFGKLYAMIFHRLAIAQRHNQIYYFEALFLVLGRICKIDGHVSEQEIKTIEGIFQELDLTAEQRRLAIQFFKKGQANDFDLKGTLTKLRTICGAQKGLLRLFLETQLMAARIDGVTPEQQQLLNTLCDELGFKAKFYQRAKKQSYQQDESFQGRWQKEEHRSYQDLPEDALHNQIISDYALLEVDSDVSAAELKKAYRRLMSQHHPDKLIAKGLPENMIKMATRKTQAIQKAYERIKEAKGY